MKAGFKQLGLIPHSVVPLLARELQKHSIPFRRYRYPGFSAGPRSTHTLAHYDRFFVEASNLCCAQTIWDALKQAPGANATGAASNPKDAA
jgi:hypothetical protein